MELIAKELLPDVYPSIVYDEDNKMFSMLALFFVLQVLSTFLQIAKLQLLKVSAQCIPIKAKDFLQLTILHLDEVFEQIQTINKKYNDFWQLAIKIA